jgi:triphosphoribosyl-dephospho-CoA synthase
MNTENRIARLAHMACVLEACAPKPGNVNRCHDFADTSLEDFLVSAAATGPAFENASQMEVGRIIWQATVDTRQRVHVNTNLGITLLLAPLVKACVSGIKVAGQGTTLVKDIGYVRKRLHSILESLTVEDACLAFAAIRLARPGGLGQVPNADVSEEPSVTLLEAMALAKDRDAIAREYATDFEITFEIGLPALKEVLATGEGFFSAIVHTFLTILKRVPDTLIARKRGQAVALHASQWASRVLSEGSVFTSHGRALLAEMDKELRDPDHALNPGTTADLTAAALFLALIADPRW